MSWCDGPHLLAQTQLQLAPSVTAAIIIFLVTPLSGSYGYSCKPGQSRRRLRVRGEFLLTSFTQDIIDDGVPCHLPGI
jgi:hypothetical protein